MEYLEGRREPWWQAAKDDVHREVFRSVEDLDDTQSYRRESFLQYLRMYSNRLAQGLSGSTYATHESGDRLKLNVVRSVVDAAIAKIATNRPRAQFLTTGGNYSQIQRAKKLTRFIDGQFYATRVYQKDQQVFMNAAVYGNGFAKILENGGRIGVESVFPNEILVDDREAKYGEPRQMFQHKEMDRWVLAQLFPKHSEDIQQSRLIRDDSGSYLQQNAEPVSCVEAWHLPSGPGAKDGRHVIAVSNAVLLDERWACEDFPFAVFRWSEPPLGYWGIGLVEELKSIQIEINWLLIRAQEHLNLTSMQLWMKKSEASGAITNRPGGINFYTNTQPIALKMGGVPAEIIQQIDRLYAKAFEIAGISQLSAQSKKPSGLDSGAALREFNDIQSERFQHTGQRWEQFHLDMADQMILRAREIEESGDGDLKVLAAGSREVEEISFSDVSIDEDKYTMRAFPTSLLPLTPAGQIQTITELAQASPDMARYLLNQLDHPDLEGFNDLVNAKFSIIDMHVESMLERGEPQMPLPYMDIETARIRVTQHLLRAEKDGAEDSRLQLLREYLAAADEFMAPAEQAPPAPVPGPAGPMPGSEPMPTPGAAMPPVAA